MINADANAMDTYNEEVALDAATLQGSYGVKGRTTVDGKHYVDE